MSPVFILSILAFLAYLGAGGVMLSLHFRPTEYHPLKHALSDYGVGSSRRLFHLYLWLTSLGALILSVALFVGLKNPPARAIAFLFFSALARIGVSLFPTDLEGHPLTRHGFWHYIFAILTIGLTYTAIIQFTKFFRAAPDWQGVSQVLVVLLDIATPALVAIVITMWRPLRRYFALIERLFVLSTTLWFNKPPCAKSAGYCRMGHGTEAKTALVLPLPVPGLGLGCSFQ